MGAPRPGIRSRRWPLTPTLPFAVVVVLIGTAVFAPLITPWNPVKNDLIHAVLPPDWGANGLSGHLLGTDGFGRDVFARLIYGSRLTLLVVAFSLLIAVTLGSTVGLVAGYKGGRVETVLMRLTDSLLTLPRILVALVVAIAVGASFLTLVVVIGLMVWMDVARLVRGETKVLVRKDFVIYSRAIGVPGWMIVLRHVLPNVLPVITVVTTLEIGHVILLEAALSFLGAGLPPPQPSWGVMISDGRALIATGWWIALFPGLMIMATVLASNGLGDWLRDYLDPRTRQRG